MKSISKIKKNKTFCKNEGNSTTKNMNSTLYSKISKLIRTKNRLVDVCISIF